MKSWPRTVIRTFAVLSILFGVDGLLSLLSSVYIHIRVNAWDQSPRHFAEIYFLRSAINLVFVLTAIWVGPQLWRLRPRARVIANVLFSAEILYFGADLAGFLILHFLGAKGATLSLALGASEGSGSMGVALQNITAYPLIALVGINIAYRRLKSL